MNKYITIKNIVRFVTLAPLSIYLLYCISFFILNPMRPKYNDCGVIISKSNDEITIKHGVKTELYLNIHFNRSGFKSIEVSPTTYFKYYRGDTVCFDINQEHNGWYDLKMMIGVVMCVIIIVILIALLGNYMFS